MAAHWLTWLPPRVFLNVVYALLIERIDDPEELNRFELRLHFGTDDAEELSA